MKIDEFRNFVVARIPRPDWAHCRGLYSNKYCVVLLWVLQGRVQCKRQQFPSLRNFRPVPSFSPAAGTVVLFRTRDVVTKDGYVNPHSCIVIKCSPWFTWRVQLYLPQKCQTIHLHTLTWSGLDERNSRRTGTCLHRTSGPQKTKRAQVLKFLKLGNCCLPDCLLKNLPPSLYTYPEL